MKTTSPLLCGLAALTLLLAACASTQPTPTARSINLSPDSPKRIELDETLYLRQIGDSAYVITHTFPWQSNALLVEMANGALVIAGSTNTPQAAQVLLDWIKKEYGQRPIIAIDTGYHADNLGANQTWLANQIPVYGSDLTAHLIQERGEQVRQSMLQAISDPQSPEYQAQELVTYPPPDHAFPIADGLTLTFNGEEVRVIYPGPSQAPDKLAVYFPARKLLFGSCMIIGWDKIGNTADADMKQWPLAVGKLKDLPVNVIVPGHGDRLDPGLIQHTLDLLAAAP